MSRKNKHRSKFNNNRENSSDKKKYKFKVASDARPLKEDDLVDFENKAYNAYCNELYPNSKSKMLNLAFMNEDVVSREGYEPFYLSILHAKYRTDPNNF